MTNTPGLRPKSPHFSSGPCAKRPGWSPEALSSALTGRSHRSKEGKARLFAALKGDYAALRQSWDGYSGFDRFFDQGANNALLASIATYSVKVPAFRALLAQQGGEFPAFYREVRRLAALPVAERDAALARLAPQSAPEISMLAR